MRLCMCVCVCKEVSVKPSYSALVCLHSFGCAAMPLRSRPLALPHTSCPHQHPCLRILSNPVVLFVLVRACARMFVRSWHWCVNTTPRQHFNRCFCKTQGSGQRSPGKLHWSPAVWFSRSECVFTLMQSHSDDGMEADWATTSPSPSPDLSKVMVWQHWGRGWYNRTKSKPHQAHTNTQADQPLNVSYDKIWV